MKAPNRHLLALINYIALVPLVYFIPLWVKPYLPTSQLLQVSIIVAIIVPIISYVVMPFSLKVLARYRD
jgi:antibiotic biosynthesis monooxygenase (ABM) superfamily enzyme